MSLLPQDAPFVELVQAYFLAFKGEGVMLSPLDVDLVLDWEARGIPYPVVCRGIRRAAEASLYDARSGEGRLRSIRACRRAVEKEFLRHSGRSVGRGAPAKEKRPEEVASDRLERALKKLRKAAAEAGHPAALRAYASAETLLRPLREGPSADPAEVARALSRASDACAIAYLRALPVSERRGLLREARAAAGRPLGASARARKDTLRAHLVALTRARGDLVEIW